MIMLQKTILIIVFKENVEIKSIDNQSVENFFFIFSPRYKLYHISVLFATFYVQRHPLKSNKNAELAQFLVSFSAFLFGWG